MQYVMAGRMGPEMRQVIGFGVRSTEGGNFGDENGVLLSIVTSGEFDAAYFQIIWGSHLCVSSCFVCVFFYVY